MELISTDVLERGAICVTENRQEQLFGLLSMRKKIHLFILAATFLTNPSAEESTSLECENALTTIDMEICGRDQLEKLNVEMNRAYTSLLNLLDSGDCCDSMNPTRAKELAIESQMYWGKFRETECSGHYETMSNGTLRGALYLACSIDLTEQRISQLSNWGVAEVNRTSDLKK